VQLIPVADGSFRGKAGAVWRLPDAAGTALEAFRDMSTRRILPD
jgi:hypothetical protein